MSSTYTGRFAPSPTGPLHFGSLIAALASYCHARRHSGRWLVRIEDLDPPREVPGAASLILKQLERHGLSWDGDVIYQSRRHDRYRQVVAQLLAAGSAYPCDCSRRDVQAMGGRYDGRCRYRDDVDPADAAVRVHVPLAERITYDDLYQGRHSAWPGREGGDYVIRRRDGLYAYQLAVVVDDIDQGVSHIIRGVDLQEATPRQVWLSHYLGATPPVFGHIPVAVNKFGQKLSKQNHAASVDACPPAENLRMALQWLGLPLPARDADVGQLVRHAVEHWEAARLAGEASRPAPLVYQ